MAQLPLALISNDDGIHATGIHQLAKAIAPFAEVVIVAPHKDCSAFSHSITISRPLRIQKLSNTDYCNEIYEVDGTPADCVKIALGTVLKRKPDWVISGINRGGNLGTDVMYSGTVAAAMEGVINKTRAMAFSAHGSDFNQLNYESSAKVAAYLFENRDALDLPQGTMLNINTPAIPFMELKGMKTASSGHRIYDQSYHKKEDPRGLPYYWLGTDTNKFDDIPESDCNLVNAGYVSLSVLQPSLINMQQTHGLEKTIEKKALRLPQ